MSYLARFFSWAFKTLWKLAKDILMFAIRQFISIVRFALPYVYWVIITALGIALQLSVLNFLALVRPIPEVAQKTAEEWSDTAVRDGLFPSLHQLTLTKFLLVVAYGAMTLGLLVNL